MKIVVLEPIGIPDKNLEAIKHDFLTANHEVLTYDTKPRNETEIIERINGADILVLSNLSLSERIIESNHQLKLISVAFTGTDHIPVELCKKRNIVVCNASGYSTHAVAELTIAMILSLLRKITWCNHQTRNGKSRENFLGSELHGKTFGVVGFGQIGSEVARLASAFGCNVLAHNRSTRNADKINFVDLETLLATSDIISLHLPLAPETKHLIGEKELSLLKPSALLINTARGPVIDYHSLYKSLKCNKIAGAALDVYEQEPPLDKNYPLFELPNVLVLPHIGYATNEAIEKRGRIVFENITKWMEGNPQNIVN